MFMGQKQFTSALVQNIRELPYITVFLLVNVRCSCHSSASSPPYTVKWMWWHIAQLFVLEAAMICEIHRKLWWLVKAFFLTVKLISQIHITAHYRLNQQKNKARLQLLFSLHNWNSRTKSFRHKLDYFSGHTVNMASVFKGLFENISCQTEHTSCKQRKLLQRFQIIFWWSVLCKLTLSCNRAK